MGRLLSDEACPHLFKDINKSHRFDDGQPALTLGPYLACVGVCGWLLGKIGLYGLTVSQEGEIYICVYVVVYVGTVVYGFIYSLSICLPVCLSIYLSISIYSVDLGW